MMQLYRLGTIADKKAALKQLGVESGGVAIMAKKMQMYYFYIKDLRTPAANILKQDALSIGAELAVPGGVITCEKEHYDCILIGTKKHMEILARKELAQPFGLKKVAQELKKFLTETGSTNLALYIDHSTAVLRTIRAVGLPTSVLIDRKGKEIGRMVGPADWFSPDAIRLIKTAIAEK